MCPIASQLHVLYVCMSFSHPHYSIAKNIIVSDYVNEIGECVAEAETAFEKLESKHGENPRIRLRRTHAADAYTLAACGLLSPNAGFDYPVS